MATNCISQNCNNFFADRKIVMKFEGKDFPFHRTDILKNRGNYKLMYQNLICQCKSFSATFKSLEEMQYITFGWLCRRKKAYSRFHGLPSNRQNSFNITATPRLKAQAMRGYYGIVKKCRMDNR